MVKKIRMRSGKVEIYCSWCEYSFQRNVIYSLIPPISNPTQAGHAYLGSVTLPPFSANIHINTDKHALQGKHTSLSVFEFFLAVQWYIFHAQNKLKGTNIFLIIINQKSFSYIQYEIGRTRFVHCFMACSWRKSWFYLLQCHFVPNRVAPAKWYHKLYSRQSRDMNKERRNRSCHRW